MVSTDEGFHAELDPACEWAKRRMKTDTPSPVPPSPGGKDKERRGEDSAVCYTDTTVDGETFRVWSADASHKDSEEGGGGVDKPYQQLLDDIHAEVYPEGPACRPFGSEDPCVCLHLSADPPYNEDDDALKDCLLEPIARAVVAVAAKRDAITRAVKVVYGDDAN